MNVSPYERLAKALTEIILQMLTELMTRIHQKNPCDLELWELNPRELYLVRVKMMKDLNESHPRRIEAIIEAIVSHTKY